MKTKGRSGWVLVCFTTFGCDGAHTFAGQLLMRVDQAGESNFSTAGSPAAPQRAEMSIPTPVEPPVERTLS